MVLQRAYLRTPSLSYARSYQTQEFLLKNTVQLDNRGKVDLKPHIQASYSAIQITDTQRSFFFTRPSKFVSQIFEKRDGVLTVPLYLGPSCVSTRTTLWQKKNNNTELFREFTTGREILLWWRNLRPKLLFERVRLFIKDSVLCVPSSRQLETR